MVKATSQADREAASKALDALKQEHDALQAKFQALAAPSKP